MSSTKLLRFELNSAGVRELLRGEAMQGVLMEYAQGVAHSAGEGYSTWVGPNRANVSVTTATEEAYQDNLDNNTLEKAIRS
jgi:hypothetical protein